ncbi:hypothetical protein [Deinococcus sp.]|uniref:hypothetical protein n=1 Tax=Deinococcus sp. TaxID=47478 RepID=UPI003C797703
MSLLREAGHLETPPARLLLLATDANRRVRSTALANLALPLDSRAILLRAHQGEALASPELEWLSTLGAYGKEVAARNIATSDRVLLNLARQGHLKSITQGKHPRDAAWFLEQARTDPTLLGIISRDLSVGWPVRRQAINLLKFLPPESSVPAETVAPVQTPVEPVPIPTPESLPVATLRERLLDRKHAYTLTEQEAEELSSTPALRRLAARHPHTHVRLLEWLDTQQPYGPARENLLTQLGHRQLDDEARRHFALHRDWELRAALAPNPCLPLPLLELLARDADTLVRAASAEHPELPPTTLERLAADDSSLVREAVAAHPATPPQVLAHLAGDEEWEVGLNVARNPSSDEATLALLAASAHFQVREAVASNMLTDTGILKELAFDTNERVAEVARLRLPGATRESLEVAAHSKRRNVKLALATQQGAPRELLLALSADRSSAVRALAGLHPQLDHEARQRLRDDPDPQVRRVAHAADSTATAAELSALPRFDARVKVALSRNGSTPGAVLDTLSDDPQDAVRLLVVAHPATPIPGLERRLPELELRPLLRQHPHYRGRLQARLHEQELQEATQPDVSDETLLALMESDSVDVRGVLARHERTPLALQLLLTADPAISVRVALLERAVVSEEVQRVLVKDAAQEVQAALIGLPELDEGVMLELLRQPTVGAGLLMELAAHPNITPPVLAGLARQFSAPVRILAALHHLTPAATLQLLAADPQESVRQAVAAHPGCPPAVLHLLAQRPEHRLAVAVHPSTPPRTLEYLVYDAGYARAVRLPQRPKVVNMIRAFLLHRASQRAFPQMALLLAVIHHPNATTRAVRYASRLNHTEIEAAVLSWRAARPQAGARE